MAEIVVTNETILVAGGGICRTSAALEAAEFGKQVILAMKSCLFLTYISY